MRIFALTIIVYKITDNLPCRIGACGLDMHVVLAVCQRENI